MPNDLTTGLLLADQHEAALPHLAGADVDWLAALRSEGMASYRHAGLPSQRIEAWRYTRLHHLSKLAPTPADMAPPAVLDQVPAPHRDLVDGPAAVFVNGRFRPELSRLTRLPKGVQIASLADLLASDDPLLREHLGSQARIAEMPLAALNTAYLSDGLLVALADGAALDRPLHLISIAAPVADPIALQPRLLLALGEGASLTLVESHGGLGEQGYLTNLVTEAHVGAGATLRHYKAQLEQPEATHLASIQVSLADRAAYEGFTLHLGAAVGRQEYHVELAGTEARAHVNGAYVATAGRHHDTLTQITHAATDGLSRQRFHGVIDTKGHGVFQGKVLVQPGAQRTDGHQLNRALLLSPGARIDAKPELEIYADDVKCSHGATVGELDEDALYYLRTRGIPPAIARRMLIEAFLGEAVAEITDTAIRQAFADLVRSALDDIDIAAAGEPAA